MMSKITEYFKETKGEFAHVIWPKKSQTFFYTIIVIVLSIVTAYLLGFFDYVFSLGLEKLLSF